MPGADPRDVPPSRGAPLSTSSCGCQSDGHRNRARREATDIKCGGQSPGPQALGLTKRRSVKGDRIVHLLLSRRGKALALQFEQREHQVEVTLAEQG